MFLFQLIIGFESGIVVLWDLKSKKADYRYTYDEVGACFPPPALSPRPVISLALLKLESKDQIFILI